MGSNSSLYPFVLVERFKVRNYLVLVLKVLLLETVFFLFFDLPVRFFVLARP